MTKKKVKKLTKKPQKKKKVWDRKGGRPLGTQKRFHFSQTKLGFFLKYEAPFEYYLLMDGKEHRKLHYAPEIEDILTITKTSNNPVFKKAKFSRYLKEYDKDGLYCRRGKYLTKSGVKFYNHMRDREVYQQALSIVPKLRNSGKI